MAKIINTLASLTEVGSGNAILVDPAQVVLFRPHANPANTEIYLTGGFNMSLAVSGDTTATLAIFDALKKSPDFKAFTKAGTSDVVYVNPELFVLVMDTGSDRFLMLLNTGVSVSESISTVSNAMKS